jgi:tetratricopeptide (TPR) repeat protein
MKKRVLSFVCGLFVLVSAQAQNLAQGLRDIDFEKYEASRTVFTKLVKDDAANGDYWYYLGQTYVNLLNLDSAAICYNQGIKVAPANPSNYAGLGELELLAENKDKAKVHFEKALSFSKSRSGIIGDIRALTVVASSMVNNSSIKLLDEAEELIKMGYEQDKKNYDLLVAGGDVYLERNDGGNAATFYERAISVDPKNPKAYTRVSGIWIRVKNYEQAQIDLNRAFEKDPNYAPAWKNQAELYYAQRKFAQAKEAYATYLSNSEPSIPNQIRFARILYLSGAYDEALITIDEIQKKDKETLLLYRFRAFSISEIVETKADVELAKSGLGSLEFYFSKQEAKRITATDYEYLGKLQAKAGGKDSLAVLNLKKAMELNPYNVDNYTNLAKLYNKLKQFDSAVVAYESYMAKAKKVNAADYFLYGKALYYAKQYNKADSAFTKVNELKPDYPDAYLWRGNCNSAMDPDFESDFAKVHYDKYIQLLTADAEKFETTLKAKNKSGLINAYGYLGFYFLNKDKKVEAKEYYKKVIELDPNNVKAKTVLSEMK